MLLVGKKRECFLRRIGKAAGKCSICAQDTAAYGLPFSRNDDVRETSGIQEKSGAPFIFHFIQKTGLSVFVHSVSSLSQGCPKQKPRESGASAEQRFFSVIRQLPWSPHQLPPSCHPRG